MVSVTGEYSENYTIIAIDEALQSEVLLQEFMRGEYHYISCDIAGNVLKIMSAGAFDLIKQHTQNPDYISEEQLHVLITPAENTADYDFFQCCDILLNANPHLLKQLKQQIDLHRKYCVLQSQVEIQERKSSEINLLKNAIVRNVSHELRTPLLQVKSAVALIVEDPKDKSLSNYATNAVARLETHVANITMLGHSLNTSVTPIILRDAIEYARRNLSRIWTRQSDAQRIQVQLESNLPPIMADKQGLSTVLQLLMDNALKFGEPNNIEVIGQKSGDKVYVAVRDYGIGIAKDKLQLIFESFRQVDDSSTRPYGGAGVGLALAKVILENHQTTINVDSQPGEGSTFWFELPYITLDTME